MGLTCPKCGADNLLNAIFCRQCGDKLDLAAMKPEQVAAAAVEKKKGASLGQKIFVSVFFGLVIIIGGGLICPSGGAIKGNEPTKEIEKSYKAVKKGKKPKEGKGYTFTSQEASAMLNKALGFPRQAGDVIPTNLTVDFKNDNVIRVVLATKLYGFLPMDNCVKIKYNVTSKGTVDVQVLSAKIGQVPMIGGGLKGLVVEKIQRATGCNISGDIQDIIKNTKASNCTNGSIVIEP